jgi:superoxide dismutase, Cu-Zn family
MASMRTVVVAGVATMAMLACGGSGPMSAASTTPSPEAVATANDVTAAAATLRDTTGAEIGTAQLTSDQNGAVHVVLAVHGLPAGTHGVHFHALGECVAAGAFASAGGHFNPRDQHHGLENPAGPHAGDLPNLVVNADGTGTLDAVTGRATLRSGPATLFDADGTAIVIHADADDQKTDPSGGSGARIACGVIQGQ